MTSPITITKDKFWLRNNNDLLVWRPREKNKVRIKKIRSKVASHIMCAMWSQSWWVFDLRKQKVSILMGVWFAEVGHGPLVFGARWGWVWTEVEKQNVYMCTWADILAEYPKYLIRMLDIRFLCQNNWYSSEYPWIELGPPLLTAPHLLNYPVYNHNKS